MTESEPFRVYVETGTVDHVIRVTVDDTSMVELQSFWGFCRDGKYLPLRVRIRQAWQALRGDGQTWEEFGNPDGLQQFIDALVAAKARLR